MDPGDKSSLTPLFLVLFLIQSMLFGVGVVWAGTAAYEMVMNKNNDLCTTFHKLVNDDLKKYGQIRYEAHEMFGAIAWKPMDFLGEKFKDYNCARFRMAKFDINNDKRDEMVVRFSGCFKSKPTDSIYILEANEALADRTDLIEKSIGRFPADKTTLTNYPAKDQKFDGSIFEGVGGWLILNPFIYKGTYYVAVTDRSGGGFVIGKYIASGELDDLCYFQSKKIKDFGKPSKKDRGH